MPNWCYNNVTFMGSQKKLQFIADVINDKGSTYLYESLCGLHPKIKEIGERWANVERIGCKWDIPTSDIDVPFTIDYDDDLEISFNSAWSPTCEGTKLICKTYGISAIHEYFEEGSGFCGQSKINDKGEEYETLYEEESYSKGLYQIWDFTKWYDWWFIPKYEDWDGDGLFKDFFIKECTYLSGSDKNYILDNFINKE